MSQAQKRRYVRRKKVQPLPQEPLDLPPLQNHTLETYSDITSLQDEEYEISIMMDIIKMQEREERERSEREKEKQIRDAEELEEKIKIRDHNIKEILRKLKHGKTTSELETYIIGLLEKTIETQDMHIHVNDSDLYYNICCYLGIGDENKKATIRLPENVKVYAKNLFIFTHQI